MWMPTRTLPFGRRCTDRASSKSFASSGSMVMVGMARKSSRPAQSALVTTLPKALASAATAGGNSGRRP